MKAETKNQCRQGWQLYRLEKKRMLASPLLRLAIIASVLLPLFGTKWYHPATTATATSLYIGNPHLAAGLFGTMLWIILTLVELHRVQKQQMEALTDVVISPVILQAVKTAALLRTAIGTCLLLLLCWLPWTIAHVQPFPGLLYLLSGLILLLPCWLLGILLAAGCYQLTRRFELAFILCAVAVFFSCSTWAKELYLCRWVNPLVPVMSDHFSNQPALTLAFYSRICWFLLVGGVWLLSLLAMRCYQFGILRSFQQNCKRYQPVLVLAVVFLCTAAFCLTHEPYIDDSPLEGVFADEDVPETVFFQHSTLDVEFQGLTGSLQGTAAITLHNKGTKTELCNFKLNPGYTVKKMQLNGKPWAFTDLQNDTDNEKMIQFELPAGENQQLDVVYGGRFKIWSILRDTLMGDSISNRYIAVSNRAVGPQFFLQREEDAETVFRFTLPAKLVPVTNGDTLKLIAERGGSKQWETIIDTARINLYAADYVQEPIIEAGMYINFYYSSQQEKTMVKLGAMEQIKYAFRYCAEHYGPLPFDAAYPLRLLEETAYVMGGGAFGNFSAMGETIFSPYNLEDPARGASGAEVLAHEIVHQWWGLSWMTWDEGPWSSEGLTCYTTYRMMKEKYGEDYARRHYIDQWKDEVRRLQKSYYYRHPEKIAQLPEAYQANIKGEQESTLRYSVMPLLLLQAEQKLGGEAQIDQALTTLFNNGGQEMEGYLTWHDFLDVCGLTEEDLDIEKAILL